VGFAREIGVPEGIDGALESHGDYLAVGAALDAQRVERDIELWIREEWASRQRPRDNARANEGGAKCDGGEAGHAKRKGSMERIQFEMAGVWRFF
jgi:hypothetical protein